MVIARLFTRHPTSVGETYTQHLCAASSFGIRMIVGGLACLLHALLPFLFEHTASRCIKQLHERMVLKRSHSRSAVPQYERG